MSHEIELPTISARKSIALIALGMGIYLIYLYQVGFQDILSSLKNVNLTIFSLGFLLALAGVVFDALAWKEITLKFDYKVSLLDLFLIYMSAIFMNNLIPSGSFAGETARIYFLEKLDGGSRIDRPSATVAASRIITSIPFFLGTAIGLTYLAMATKAPAWALIACTAITILLLFFNFIFLGICFADNWLERIIFAIVDYFEKIFRIRVDRLKCGRIMSQFHQSMKMLAEHKLTLFISTFWAILGWLCMTLVASVIFKSMGLEVPLKALFAVYAVMIFLQMLPLFLPGGLGLVDIVMSTLFAAIGVPMSSAVAATILIRLIQLWFLTALGSLATAYLVRKINHKNVPALANKGMAKGF